VKVAALCAGYGGLELGLQHAGVDVELVWFAEVDPNAAAVMSAHHPDAPNLGDLTAIEDCPAVDIVTAGFPCQPVSQAGKRKGVHDERWLIEDVCNIGRRSGADRLILENVAGLLTANDGDAMARVVSSLAENGFDARWTCVRASDVGAPHGRLRWFCVADADGGGHGGTQNGGRVAHLDGSNERPSRVGQRSRQVAEHRSTPATTYADVPGRGEQRRTIPVPPQLTSPEHAGDVATRFGPYADAVARWEPIVGRAAPDPTDNQRRLNPRFVEWMMGLPDGWVTDVIPNRSPALKMLGNGVVPQQAGFALALLGQT